MSSRNDDPETPPEKENNSGSSLDHMDDIELGRVPPPTKLDLSRLNETKIAKIEMERSGKKDVPESDADDTGDIGDFDYTSLDKKLVDGKWVTIREADPSHPYVRPDDDTSTKDELPPGCDYHPTDYCMDPERGSPSTILSTKSHKCRDVRKDGKCSLGYEYPYNIDHILRKVKEMLSIEHPTILDGGVAEVYIDDALVMVSNITPNRADGPKSPCCGVVMVWINAKQHYICPNCGKPPGNKKCECHEGKSLGPGWPKCPYCGGELYTEESDEEPETLIGRRVHLKHAPDAVGTVILGVRWDRTGDISNYEVMVRNDVMEPPIEEITPVVEWPDTDECPLSHEKHPECEGCNLEGGCTRGEHILRHRKMEEGEQITVHVDDRVRVFGSRDPPEDVGRPQSDAMGGTEEPVLPIETDEDMVKWDREHPDNPRNKSPEEPEPETYDRCERCEPKCDAATPIPVEEPIDITLLPDFPEKKSNIVISAEDLEKEEE